MADDPPRVALLPTCVLEALAPDVGAAVVRTLRARGYDVHIPDGVTCCGQPAWNAGFVAEAAAVAATTLAALDADPAEVVCVPAGSCATMMRVYWPELFRLAGDEEASRRAEELLPRVKEFTELLDPGEDVAPDGGEPVAYHHSCHMLRELHLAEPPERVLHAAGHPTVTWDGADRCCGFGGLFAVKEPEISVAMADEKIDSLLAGDARCLVGADLSCLLQLEGRLRRRGIDLPVRHIAELLDPGPAS
jgi:Fe-S oxidoreductase